MHTHRRSTPNTHPIFSGSHLFDAACTMIINKISKMSKQKRGEDLEVWHTHCLAHHSPGAQNKYYQAYPVVSQEAITCNNTSVAQQLGNNSISDMTRVSFVRTTRVENGNTPDSGCTGPGESEGGGGGRSRGAGMEDSLRDFLMDPALGSLPSSSGALSISCQTHTHARRAHHRAGTLNTNNVRTLKVSQQSIYLT